ncbi:hypothetical protein GOODEAATRI_005491 [Goodea atripinnis]|uniref:Uncharacterized protein n=1 Tax=Goodea atripinnis TaxID=208336 RepID=A0ABV0N899_9TELE
MRRLMLLLGQVWMEAGAQIFFSYSVGVGSLIVLGSYNKPNNNCYRYNSSFGQPMAVFPEQWYQCRSWVCSVLCAGIHGSRARHSHCRGGRVRCIFIHFQPHVTSFLWKCCGMQSRPGIHRIPPGSGHDASAPALVHLLLCHAHPLGSGHTILLICHYLGADRLYGIIKDMTGVHANPFFKICWLYLTPLVSLGSFVCSLVQYQPLTFNRWYTYPSWAYVLGWVLALSSIMLVPGWALYKLATGSGTPRQKYRKESMSRHLHQ